MGCIGIVFFNIFICKTYMVAYFIHSDGPAGGRGKYPQREVVLYISHAHSSALILIGI